MVRQLVRCLTARRRRVLLAWHDLTCQVCMGFAVLGLHELTVSICITQTQNSVESVGKGS